MNNQPYNNDSENEISNNITSENTEVKTKVPTVEELEEVEYVLPVTHKNQKKSRKIHNNKTIKTKEEIEKESSDFVFAQPHKEKKKSKVKKVLLIILIVLLSLVLILTSTVLIFRHIGKKAMLNYKDMVIKPPSEVENISKIENDGKTVVYNGKTYVFNEEIATVVMMGIDKDDLGITDEIVGTGGQADAIFIGIINNKSGKVSILSVSRDSMVDVNIYNTKGEFVKTDNMQLCLSFAYGDGKETSTKNTINSLERLFYGMKFNTYLALDYKGLHELNDAVGGVTVTATSDFYSYNERRTVKKGETFTLWGPDSEQYLRTRDLSELESNTDRMDRQKQYITALLSNVVPAAKKDITVVTKLFDAVKDNSTTNLNASKITYLATEALGNIDSYKNIGFYSVPGTVLKGEKYAEFHVDQTALWELMLELFYIEK